MFESACGERRLTILRDAERSWPNTWRHSKSIDLKGGMASTTTLRKRILYCNLMHCLFGMCSNAVTLLLYLFTLCLRGSLYVKKFCPPTRWAHGQWFVGWEWDQLRMVANCLRTLCVWTERIRKTVACSVLESSCSVH